MENLTSTSQGQTNWYLGMNTAYFHLQYPLPDLIYTAFNGSFSCSGLPAFNGQLPFPGEVTVTGGTPNQKTERVANQIASTFFVTPGSPSEMSTIYGEAVDFFNDQAQDTGHQCVGDQDEALTASHGPIWWRAVMSLRITSWAIANGKVSGFSADSALENAILGWIQCHYALSQLGEILAGPEAGMVLLPGARWTGPPTSYCPPDKADSMTDQMSNVIYQILKTGSTSVPWPLGENFWNLDPCDLDNVAAPLAKSVLDNGLGFGTSSDSAPLLLNSRLVVSRYSNGHVASFPCGMAPNTASPAIWAWADYDTGCMGMSAQLGDPTAPQFQGAPTTTTVNSVRSCSESGVLDPLPRPR